MGNQEGERNWTNVANNLLSQCHINQKLRKLTDCDANVFIALYENILGEKVPDYIAAPGCQEDDIHNVQSVIDSLSLDYLQISLSHITGENVIRGDKDSIRNLLEIFDGLLEYLKEEISEESNNEEAFDSIPAGITEPRSCSAAESRNTEPEKSSSSTGESPAHSSKHSFHSSDAEEQGPGLLGLGASARTFTAEQDDGVTTSCPPDNHTDPENKAPPTQSDGPPAAEGPSREQRGQEAAEMQSCPSPAEGALVNGLQSPATERSLSLSCQLRARLEEEEEEEEALEPTPGGLRRVLFRPQPDVLYLSLQDERAAASLSPPHSGEEDRNENTWATNRPSDIRTCHKHTRRPRTWLQEERSREGSPSYRRQKNKEAEEELHHISEKLSHRLEELDQMLKRVLGESGAGVEGGEEDQGSRHRAPGVEGGEEDQGSRHRAPRPHADSDSGGALSAHRTRSSSPCSSPGPSSLQEGGAAPPARQEGGTRSSLAAAQRSRRDPHHRPSHRKHKHQHKSSREDEETEGRRDEEADVDEARLRAQEAERRYREAILRDASQVHTPPGSRKKPQHQPSTLGRRHPEIRRPPPMRVRENELLPLLLEELPHLDISSHTQGRMWQRQKQQADRLGSLASPSGRRRGNLGGQLEEAQRKHDLLVALLHKDREHKRRLKELNEHNQQQKSIQNRVKEQRQQAARARKYYSEHVQHRARLMKMRTKEEKMFRQLFEEGLELQKVRLREQRAHAREQRQQQQRRRQDQLASMENYYKDQFSILAEKLAQERQEVQVQKKAQEKALLKMKRELRLRMEHEIEELQKIISQNNEDDFAQGLEVQRLRNRMQAASFQFSSNYLQ